MPRTRTRTRSSAARPAARREIQAGCILWLQPKAECTGGGAVGLDDGCYDHPVVVLWADEVVRKAIVLIVTSFDCHDLKERHPNNPQVRALHLPISPSAPHPDNGHQLFLHGGMALRKNSYVKTERHFQVGLEMLRPYRKDGEQDFKLSRESFDVLVKYIKFTPPPPRASQRTQITGYPPPHAPSPSTAASRATPPRRTRTYPNIADLPYSSPSAASPGLPVSYSRTDEWTTRTRHPPDSLPYDERSRLISSNVSAPEGDSLPPICKGFLFVVVASVLCAGVYFAPKIGPSVKAYLGL